MLRGFGSLFFFQHVTDPFSDWFFQLGLQAVGWSTAATLISLRDEILFSDLGAIRVPTLILHDIHDKICLFPLAEAQKKGIKNSKLIPFNNSGHGLFWEERGPLETCIQQVAKLVNPDYKQDKNQKQKERRNSKTPNNTCIKSHSDAS